MLVVMLSLVCIYMSNVYIWRKREIETMAIIIAMIGQILDHNNIESSDTTTTTTTKFCACRSKAGVSSFDSMALTHTQTHTLAAVCSRAYARTSGQPRVSLPQQRVERA